jgi:hypothetical protein
MTYHKWKTVSDGYECVNCGKKKSMSQTMYNVDVDLCDEHLVVFEIEDNSCTCDIRDLMSNGHTTGCKFKKK